MHTCATTIIVVGWIYVVLFCFLQHFILAKWCPSPVMALRETAIFFVVLPCSSLELGSFAFFKKKYFFVLNPPEVVPPMQQLHALTAD